MEESSSGNVARFNAGVTNQEVEVTRPGAIISQAASKRSPIRRARILDDTQIERVIAHIRATSNAPASDEVKFLLSVYAGLRVAEIAGLTLADVVDADDRIGRHIIIGRHSAKGGKQRVIPMHPKIRDALIRFRKAHPGISYLAFSSRWGARRQNVASVKNWFLLLYQQVGLQGCSSHSGRRTFITRLARKANLHGHSLRDVQLLAGHARLDTTAAYIEPAENLSLLVEAFSDETPANSVAEQQSVEVTA